jgi:hypothetical protein
MKNKVICTAILFVFCCSLMLGCATSSNVTFDSSVRGANVKIDGKDVGRTPLTVKMSNAVWENPDVVITAEGYRTWIGAPEKEMKLSAAIVGYFLFWPALLWSYGPSKYQYFTLYPEQE